MSATFCARCGAPGGAGGGRCAHCGETASPLGVYGGPSLQLNDEVAHLPRRTLVAIGVGMLVVLAVLYVFGPQLFA